MITVAVIGNSAKCVIGRLKAEPIGYEVCVRLVLEPNASKWQGVLVPLLEARIRLGITSVIVQTKVKGEPIDLFLHELVEMLTGKELVVEYLREGLAQANRLELQLSLQKPRSPSDWKPVSESLAQYGIKCP